MLQEHGTAYQFRNIWLLERARRQLASRSRTQPVGTDRFRGSPPQVESGMLKSAGIPLCLLLLLATARADDFSTDRLDNWHQWRGPSASGFAPNATPPLRWDESTNIQWKVEIPGFGSSTPIVWGDRVFVLTAIDTGRVPDPAIEPAVSVTPAAPAARQGGKKGGGKRSPYNSDADDRVSV